MRHLALVAEHPGHTALLVCVALRPPAEVTTGAGCDQALVRPLDDQRPLELRDRGEDREDQLADRRRRVDRLVKALEPDSPGFEVGRDWRRCWTLLPHRSSFTETRTSPSRRYCKHSSHWGLDALEPETPLSTKTLAPSLD